MYTVDYSKSQGVRAVNPEEAARNDAFEARVAADDFIG